MTQRRLPEETVKTSLVEVIVKEQNDLGRRGRRSPGPTWGFDINFGHTLVLSLWKHPPAP